MKVKKEHFEYMRAKIEKFVEEHKEACTVHANNPSLTEKRKYWDFANSCGLNKFICNTLYEYCNDSHIDTALKYIYRNLWL